MKSGSLAFSMMCLPACGLVVGFTPRDSCDDCEDVTSASASTTSSNINSTTSGDATSGPAASGGANSTSQGSSTEATASATSNAGGSGGTATSDTSSTVATTTAASTTNTSTTDATGGNTSSESTSAGGSASTTSTDGATTGGTLSTCQAELVGNATSATGTHPVRIALVSNNNRGWGLSWLSNNSIFFRYLSNTGEVWTDDTEITSAAGTRTAPVVVSVSAKAAVAYGEFVNDNATIGLSQFTALAPASDLATDDAGISPEVQSPVVGGIASVGLTQNFMVAAVEASGSGRLAVFGNGSLSATQSFGSGLTAIAPAWLGSNYGVFFVADGELRLATTSSNLSTITTEPIALAAPGVVTSPSSLAVAATATGAAVAWVEKDSGLMLATIDDTGQLGPKTVVSTGSQDGFPEIVVGKGHIAVAWVDAYEHKLMLRRFSLDLTESEQPVEIASDVADLSVGLSLDTLSTTTASTYAAVYNTDRIKLALVTCNE